MPVPVTGIVSGDPDPLLVTVKFPLTAPAAAGTNVTERVAVAEGFNVVGTVTPLAVNPVPEIETPVICTAAVPALVSVICFTELVPVPTFP